MCTDIPHDERRGPPILLASRRMWFPFDPRPDDFTWQDLGAGLSRVCRYNGQLPPDGVCGPGDTFSVAQHSVLAGDLLVLLQPKAPRWLRLAVHLHDGEEALSGLGDPVGPVKHHPPFRALLAPYLDKIQDVIAAKAGLFGEQLRSPEVKRWDKLIYAWENRDIRGIAPPDELAAQIPTMPIEPWTTEVAFERFMSRLCVLLDECAHG